MKKQQKRFKKIKPKKKTILTPTVRKVNLSKECKEDHYDEKES